MIKSVIGAQFTKSTKDNTGKTLPTLTQEGEGVTAILEKANKGHIDQDTIISKFAEQLRQYAKRDILLKKGLEECELTIKSLTEENAKLKLKIDQLETDPMKYIVDYTEKENLEFRYSKNPINVFRTKGQGGKWVSFPEISHYREELAKNAKSMKYRKVSSPK